MGRIEKINQCIPAICSNVFEQSLKKIESYCEEESRNVTLEFVEAMNHLMDQVYSSQQEKGKGKLCYLVFSHLHSGILLQHSRIRLEAMDHRFYTDPIETAVHLNANGIYQFLEEDLISIKKEAIQLVPRIYEYELDLIRYEYELYYHRAAKQWIRELLEGIEPDVWFERDYGGTVCEDVVWRIYGCSRNTVGME